MDPEERKKYVQGWKKRKKDREKKLERLAQQALDRANQIAQLLVNKYNVEEVILFGSLSKNTFRKESDIDLALINSDRDLYLQMFNEAYDIASPFKLNLLPFEEAPETLKSRILKRGVSLNAKKDIDPARRD